MKPVVFLDRDGVLNADSPDFVKSVEEWHPLPGALESVARLSRAGHRIVVVTNQSGLARGLFSAGDLEAIHGALASGVSRHGGRIDGIFHCPHAPEDGCPCRKPAPGLILEACRVLDLDPRGMPLVGDRETDVLAARAAGCLPVRVGPTGPDEPVGPSEAPRLLRFPDLPAFTEAWLGKGGRDGHGA